MSKFQGVIPSHIAEVETFPLFQTYILIYPNGGFFRCYTSLSSLLEYDPLKRIPKFGLAFTVKVNDSE